MKSTNDQPCAKPEIVGSNVLPAIFVGQILFREVSGRYTEWHVTEHTVTKIGKKYLECTGLRDKITISNLIHENKVYYQDNYRMYRTKQEILDKKELKKLYSSIQNAFSDCNHSQKFTLEQLRQILAII